MFDHNKPESASTPVGVPGGTISVGGGVVLDFIVGGWFGYERGVVDYGKSGGMSTLRLFDVAGRRRAMLHHSRCITYIQ